MAIRKGKCYSHISGKPYTRFSKRRPRKSYVKGVPASKIHHFEGGAKGEYALTSYLISKKEAQLRSNCLEATRLAVSKHLENKLGEKGFFMKIMIYPHHILRENPLATGAGADRYSTGMSRAFGKPIGQAARIRADQRIVMTKTALGTEDIVKEAFRRGASKLPGSYRVEIK